MVWSYHVSCNWYGMIIPMLTSVKLGFVSMDKTILIRMMYLRQEVGRPGFAFPSGCPSGFALVTSLGEGKPRSPSLLSKVYTISSRFLCGGMIIPSWILRGGMVKPSQFLKTVRYSIQATLSLLWLKHLPCKPPLKYQIFWKKKIEKQAGAELGQAQLLLGLLLDWNSFEQG